MSRFSNFKNNVKQFGLRSIVRSNFVAGKNIYQTTRLNPTLGAQVAANTLAGARSPQAKLYFPALGAQLGHIAGLTVNWIQKMGAYFLQGTRSGISKAVSAITRAGIKIYQMGYKTINGIKGFLVRVMRSAKGAAKRAGAAIIAADVRGEAWVRNKRQASKAKQPRNYQSQARSSQHQPERTIAGRIVTAVDNAFVKAADKIVPPDYGVKQNRYNSLRAMNKAKMARPRAVNRVASGLEAATASLVAAGIGTGITVAMSQPSEEE